MVSIQNHKPQASMTHELLKLRTVLSINRHPLPFCFNTSKTFTSKLEFKVVPTKESSIEGNSGIKMSYRGKGWIVAASIGAVEALKDQGFCRWNYASRLLQQHVKNQLRSYSQATKLSRPSSSWISSNMREEKIKQSEESLRKVMYLSCWGPNN